MVKLTVRVTDIQEIRSGGIDADAWKAITFTGEEVGKEFPQKVAPDIWSKNINTIGFKAENFQKNIAIGDIISVEIKLSYREHNGRYYNDVKLWSYKKADEETNGSKGDKAF